jgi:ABC-type hemin transport system ATPase subunit
MDAFDRVLLAEHGRIVADRPPNDMLASDDLSRSFRIEQSEDGWRVRPAAEGPRSSP